MPNESRQSHQALETVEGEKRHLVRREFLHGVAATALLGSLGAPNTRASVSGEPGRIKKAVKYHMIKEDLPVLDKFRLLADLGFDGTEIHVTTTIDRDEARRASEVTGVAIHGFLNSSKPDLAYAIETAAFYGATSVLVVAGRVDQEHPYDRVYREQQDRIRAALPQAEREGIKLLVENVWNNFLLSPLEMARFLDEFDSPSVGAYFDVGNVVRFGWPDQWIRILGDRVVKLDIKEYSRRKQVSEGLRKGFNVEIGEGDCDWSAVRRALVDIGYTSGWATAEVPGGDRRRLADIAARMDRVLGLVKR
ncbi:Xylose isomerase-like TIM barrel [Planctomycetes bacterium Pan216]|uniref:Xylose isomerase-like TIM barrel n=1 Tax=Kolteria novifilia TaxID=2527975 RepID=A0A518BBE6_9BACT|nr:Xylose isomerase-like TIM barrel [Planctomycetes bacterium Pan216]